MQALTTILVSILFAVVGLFNVEFWEVKRYAIDYFASWMKELY